MDFATRIAGMTNFRNVLVHAYLRINRDIVYEYLDKLEDSLVLRQSLFLG
jgi:uncharacterized protein YutE (UPF0331/DUF86 family)